MDNVGSTGNFGSYLGDESVEALTIRSGDIGETNNSNPIRMGSKATITAKGKQSNQQ